MFDPKSLLGDSPSTNRLQGGGAYRRIGNTNSRGGISMSSLGAGMKLGGGDNCNRSSSRGADAADLRAKRLARFSNTAANRCCS